MIYIKENYMNKMKDIYFFELIRDYLCDYLPLIRRRSESTIKSSKDTINIFIEYLQIAYSITIYDISIEYFNSKEICSFSNWLIQNKHNNESTVNLRISRLKAFSKYLLQNCSIEYIPQISKVSQVNKFPESKNKMPISLTLKQTKILLSMPNLENKIEFRDYCFMVLMYATACRDNEIRSLKLKDLTLDNDSGRLKIFGKGSKTRLTPILDDVVKILRKYLTQFHPSYNQNDYLFYSSTKKENTKMSNDNSLRILKKYSDRAKEEYPEFPHAYNHLLRHSRAQQLYDANMPLPMVSELLGHSNINTTEIYAQASIEKKKQAIEKVMFNKNSILIKEKRSYKKDKNTIKKLYGL